MEQRVELGDVVLGKSQLERSQLFAMQTYLDRRSDKGARLISD